LFCGDEDTPCTLHGVTGHHGADADGVVANSALGVVGDGPKKMDVRPMVVQRMQITTASLNMARRVLQRGATMDSTVGSSCRMPVPRR
jgi:hypothetical protein